MVGNSTELYGLIIKSLQRERSLPICWSLRPDAIKGVDDKKFFWSQGLEGTRAKRWGKHRDRNKTVNNSEIMLIWPQGNPNAWMGARAPSLVRYRTLHLPQVKVHPLFQDYKTHWGEWLSNSDAHWNPLENDQHRGPGTYAGSWGTEWGLLDDKHYPPSLAHSSLQGAIWVWHAPECGVLSPERQTPVLRLKTTDLWLPKGERGAGYIGSQGWRNTYYST